MMGTNKIITVIALNDHCEAMRVAAGLTIFGHEVNCIFVDRPIEENEENIQSAELLEMCDIEPVTILDDPNMQKITQEAFMNKLNASNHLVSI